METRHTATTNLVFMEAEKPGAERWLCWQSNCLARVRAQHLQHLYKKLGMTEGTCNPSAEDAEMGGGVPSVYWLASLAEWVRSSSVTVSVSPPK